MKKKFDDIKEKSSTTKETKEHAIGKITIVRKKEFKYLKYTLKFICLVLIVAIISAAITLYFFKSNIFKKEFSKNLATSESANITSSQFENLIFNSIQNVAPSLVAVTNQEYGSEKQQAVTGVVVKSDGYILTSYSSIKNFKNIYVDIPNLSYASYKANLVGYDMVTNMAILKIDVSKLQAIQISTNVNQGQFVIAVGNPSGNEEGSIAKMGIVGNPDTQITRFDKNGNEVKTSVIKSNLNIGTSVVGGVLINLQGKVVGFNTIETENGNSFADTISATYGEDVINQLINNGSVQRVILGIKGTPASTGGFKVQSVEFDGSAYKAGIRENDIIYEVNGVRVNNINEIVTQLQNFKINQEVPVVIIRNGKQQEINMKLVTKEG